MLECIIFESILDRSMKVRVATPNDVSLIASFIHNKAEFDRTIGAFSGMLQVSEDKVSKTLFGATPFAYVLFAKILDVEVGFALYGFRYSSFICQPSIWLDDLYVDTEMRSQSAGAMLMDELARIAKVNDCSHLGWNADARNTRGISFYHRLGAEIIEQHGNRCFFKWIP
jgi:GNAT superfamily N-acetyltransferase